MALLRPGLFVGLGVGYVLGTKAGRARYEQIVEVWEKVKGAPAAQQLGEEVRVAASGAADTLEAKASEGMAKVTGIVRGETGATPSSAIDATGRPL